MRHVSLKLLPGLLLASLLGCSARSTPERTEASSSAAEKAPENTVLVRLFSRAWRLPNASGAAPGSIYIFLPNGTLLQTSCVETYRVATWTADEKDPQTLRIAEDHQETFTARVDEAGNTLRLTQKLLRGKGDIRELTLTPVDQEFVCPDLRK